MHYQHPPPLVLISLHSQILLKLVSPSIIDDSDAISDLGRSVPGQNSDLSGSTSPKPVALKPSTVQAPHRSMIMSPLDIHASTIEHQLHLYSQELSARLDQLADDAVKSVPRLLHDIAAIARDASSLATLISSVSQELDRAARSGGTSNFPNKSLAILPQASSSSVNDAFEALQQLDKVRTRMEMTRQRLRETENWSTLTTELDAIFVSGDLERAGQRLLEASRSLQLLEGTPEQEERKALLGKLRNRLELDLGPKLVAAIQSRDLEAARKCWILFEQIGRKTEFESCYFRTRRAPVVKVWIDGTERLHAKSNIEAMPGFVDVLSIFYDEMLLMLNSEIEWCLQTFPNPRNAIVHLIHQTFSALKPSLQAKLEGLVSMEPSDNSDSSIDVVGGGDIKSAVAGRLLRHSQNKFLPTLIRCYIVTVEWCREVEKSVLYPLPLATSNIIKGAAKKRASALTALGALDGSDFSNSDDGAFDQSRNSAPVDPSWGQPVFDAFLSFQQSYGALETAHLSRCLPSALRSLEILQTVFRTGTPSLSNPPGNRSSSFLNDAVRSLTEAVPKVFSNAEAALLRCLDLTAGYGFPGLIEAVNAYLSDALDSFASAIFQIRDEMGLEDEGMSIASLSGNPTSPSVRRRQVSSRNVGKTSAEDTTQSEWMRFQVGLRVLAVSRTLSYRMEVLEKGMMKALTKIKPIISTSYNSDEGNLNHYNSNLGESEVALGASDIDLFSKDSIMDLSSSSSPRQPDPTVETLANNEVWRAPCHTALAALQVSSLNSMRLHQLLATVSPNQAQERNGGEGAASSETKGPPQIPTDLPHLNLLSPVLSPLRAIIVSSQRLIFDSLFVPIDRQLATVPHLRMGILRCGWWG
ncbi:oligomeric Golgi complex subunit 7 [Chytridium lagenaria]|nr:oligomeric Golgi complex subunit 7 [Chytridium lagenaria]